MSKLRKRFTYVLRSFEPEVSISHTREWIQNQLNGHLSFVIELAPPSSDKSTGVLAEAGQDGPNQPKVIGAIGSSTRTGLPWIGYAMNMAFWGKGYMTEALQGLADVYWREYPNGYPGIKEEDRDVLMARTVHDNYASQ